jgi:hypothetical protein
LPKANVGFSFSGPSVLRPEEETKVSGTCQRRQSMNTKKRLERPARLGVPEQFEWHVDPPAPFRGLEETELETLKQRLLRLELVETVTAGLLPLIRRAANEAASLAWLEPVPLLVFPALFEEKVLLARKRFHKQGLIHSRSVEIMEAAA